MSSRISGSVTQDKSVQASQRVHLENSRLSLKWDKSGISKVDIVVAAVGLSLGTLSLLLGGTLSFHGHEFLALAGCATYGLTVIALIIKKTIDFHHNSQFNRKVLTGLVGFVLGTAALIAGGGHFQGHAILTDMAWGIYGSTALTLMVMKIIDYAKKRREIAKNPKPVPTVPISISDPLKATPIRR